MNGPSWVVKPMGLLAVDFWEVIIIVTIVTLIDCFVYLSFTFRIEIYFVLDYKTL